MFHVQTEDSGVSNPHVFTHLFHGGVIINTRKLEYDPNAAEDVVKSLMQAQHKVVLKLLRRGEFDDKIDQYLGHNPDLKPREQPAESKASERSLKVPDSVMPSKNAAANATPDQEDDAVTVRSMPVPPPKPPPIPRLRPSNRPPRRYPRPGTASRTKIAPAPPPAAPRYQARGGVVVSKPPIVVDSASRNSGSQPVRRTVRERSGGGSIFDQSQITEKSLDEVILAYLSEDAED